MACPHSDDLRDASRAPREAWQTGRKTQMNNNEHKSINNNLVCIYIYIYTYVCMCVYIYIYISMYISVAILAQANSSGSS